MSPRTTAILFALAAALAAFVFFHEQADDREPSASESDGRRVFADLPADPDLVESVSFTTEDGMPVRVERRDGRWRVVEPIDAPADQQVIEGMASTLVALSSEGVIEQPQPASVYGLDDPTRALRFRLGGEERVLRVGAKTPVGPNSYVADASSERVFIVSTWKINSLSQSLLDIRDRRVLPFDPGAVVRLTVSWPGAGVTLERTAVGDDDAQGEGRWRVVAPEAWRADDPAVDTLLSDLSFLRAESFVDEAIDEVEAGLADPVFEVSLALESDDDEQPPLHFALGTIIGGTERIASGRSGSLFRVPQELLADLPRRLVDYRYKQLSNFDAERAQAIELSFNPPGGGGVIDVRMSRSEGGWTASASDALAAGASSRLVAELARLTAVDIVAESMGASELAALGLSPAHVTFRVLDSTGEEGAAEALCEIAIGDADPERGILAKAADSDTVYRLDYALSEEVPINYGLFLENFVSKEARDEPDERDEPAEPDEPDERVAPEQGTADRAAEALPDAG